MREATCAACQNKVPMAEAFSLADRTLCRPCLENFLEQPDAKVANDDIAGLVDPTVCVRCSADQGETEWPTISGLPHCTACENFLRNRPYPNWLKIAFVVFLCVTAAAFIYNLRFFLGYVAILRGHRAMEKQDIPKAVAFYDAAVKHLPEFPEVAVMPNLFHAQELLLNNKNEEALALLHKSRPHAAPELQDAFQATELAAHSSIAFDKKDYDRFLELNQQVAKLAPNEPHAVAAIASAYACKYAATGDESFRTKAQEELARAKGMDGLEQDEFDEYENRIQHRLATREIITREEFEKKFPNGWKPGDK